MAGQIRDLADDPARLDALVAIVAELVADLSPGPGTTESDLERARLATAQAAVAGIGHVIPPSPSPKRTSVEPSALESIARTVRTAATGALSPVVAVRRRSATASPSEPMALAHAGTGRAPLATHGPFLDPFGRPVWIDVLGVADLVAVQRSGAAAPFLYVDLPPLSGTTESVPLGSGSVWVDAAQLAPGVPPSGFIGLRIRAGTLSFGQMVTAGSPIVITGTSIATLHLELDPAPAPGGTGPGADARTARVDVPATATFRFDGGGARLDHVGPGALQVLGFDMSLGQLPTPVPPSFDPLVGRLTIPMTCHATQVTVSDSRSSMATFAGTATVLQAGWALPVTVVQPTALGDAAGAGGVSLSLSAGLSLSWHDRPTGATTGPVTLVVDPGMVQVAGTSAASPGPAWPVTLWNASPTEQGRLLIRFAKRFPFGFVSESAGAEQLSFRAPFSANLDRPRTINNERIPFSTDEGWVGYLATSALSLFVAHGLAAPTVAASVASIALKNLLLKASDPLLLVAVGTPTDGGVSSGTVGLAFDLHYLLPTLPDPYAANVAFDPRRLREPGSLGVLTMLLRWQPGQVPSVDLVLPASATAQTTRLAPSGKQVASAPALVDTHDASAVAAMAERHPSVAAVSDGAVALLDVSTNVSLFGVAVTTEGSYRTVAGTADGGPAFGVNDLFFEARGSAVRVMTLPAVQWEPVVTPDQKTFFPSPLTFDDTGGPTVMATDTVQLVPVAPRPAIDALLAAYNSAEPPHPVRVRFTLPFGIVAVAEITRSTLPLIPSPFFGEVAPTFTAAGLAGGDQLSIRAAEPFFAPIGHGAGSPSLPGTAVQLHNASYLGVPTSATVLTPIDDTFNANFGPAAHNPRVPVVRVDLSGYGESLLSDWRNPTDAAAVISKTRFDVLVGRTSLEIVQAYSVLYPYAPRMVRTITVQRQNGAAVTRSDSGWQPVSDGVYRFPKPGLVTHPGVVAGVTHITNIRDTGQRFTTSDGSELMAVRFDCSVMVENVLVGADATGVPARDQLGYVQLTDPGGYGQLAPDQYAELLAGVGPLGGPIDCIADIGGSGQRMRVTRVGVAATPGMGGPEFAVAAYGSPLFPGGGQWSVLRQGSPTAAPQPLEGDGAVPLVRAGAAGSPPLATSPYRFADPQDTLRPGSPASDYCIVHATGTQRALFPRPKIEAGSHEITSTRVPLIADPFILGTSVGPFPKPDGCIPFPDAAYSLVITAGGNLRLQRGTRSFTTAPSKRVIRESQAARAVAYCQDEHGNPSVVTYAVDTAAAVPWSLSITNLSVASESGSLGEVQRIVGDVTGSAVAPTAFGNSRFLFGPCLQPIAAVVSFLEQFGPLPPLNVSMSNPWELDVSLKFDFEKLLEQVPALKPLLEKFIVDLDVLMSWTENATSQSAKTTFELTVKIPTPFTPVVAIGLAKVQFQMGDDGNAWTFELGVGIGVEFPIPPFKALAYFAETAFLITGDTVFGLGYGLLIKGSVDLGVVEVGISVEAKMALLRVTCGSESTIWGVAQVTFAFEVTIAFVLDIEFDVQVEEDQNVDGGPCPLPDVV